MLSVNNLSIHFGGRYLFDNVSFSINPTDRIGLIGRNGTGKSTLLKIIAELENPEDGRISKPNDFTIGYLPQEGIVNTDKNLWDEAALALAELKVLENQIKELTDEIASRKDYNSKEFTGLIQKLSEYNERYNLLGGHTIEANIEKILIGLGFERNDFYRLVGEFSGGWQMRLELAKILLSRPN